MKKNKKVYVIAEIGVNHDGSIKKAKSIIDEAKKCKVDAVKFQLFKSSELVTNKAQLSPYQKINIKTDSSQLEMLKKLEINHKEIFQLKKYSEKKNIDFICSAFDIESLFFLKKLRIKTFKIPSGEINNYPYLKTIGSFNKKIILSTGMSNLNEITLAINILRKFGTRKKNITILQCNTEYPSPYRDINLNVLNKLKIKFQVEVGLSDHSKGIHVPIAAVALGSKVIEKHLTLSKKSKGPDHSASLTPIEFKKMVNQIREIEIAMGSSIKKINKSEIKNIKLVRKSIVAKYNIKKGETFTAKNIITKRPGTGISPMKWESIIGKKAKQNFQKDEMIKF